MNNSIRSSWGADGVGGVTIHTFMLRTYASLGVTRDEMMCIIHMSSFYYTQPSLSTIAEEMGYDDPASVSDLIRSLEAKGLLIVTKNAEGISTYDASPFFSATKDRWSKVGPF